MANGDPDPPIGPKYVLEGRIVTMGPDGVIDDGAIYIEGGEIKHVLPRSAPTPEDFKKVKRIRTGDTIYPGLIELHNHLSYNVMPLWDVPKRYSNNGQWRNHSDYPRLITKPTQVLAGTDGVVEALIRYVECRALLGGVTTSQGVTLSSEPGLKSFYDGLVRNVEKAGDPLFPAAGTRIGNPTPGGAEAYLNTLQNNVCYLQHLSEGVDDTARQWFLNLRLASGEWAVTDALCGIHSTALKAEDFEVLQSRGGSMVWSPLSNYLLYGQTVNLEAARDSGILMGLGSDWAPSGSKNLLGEIKVAWLASELQGRIFSAEEILAMATINAARILKWQDVLGSIEPGKRADFMALNGRSGDPFTQVVEARETTVTLVIIDGVPRVGQSSLMRRFGYKAANLEKFKVGGSTRKLNLADENAHPLVASLTLTEAIQRLEAAMADLPALAQQLDANTGSGLFSGSADGMGSQWRVVLDFEDEAIDLALAAQPLADFVTEPMALPGITVADDRRFLQDLVAARNLPQDLKEWLPPLYGESIPLPASGSFLLEEKDTVPPVVLVTTDELHTFLKTWGELRRADRQLIVDQALILLEQNYVHLPFKQAMHAVDPLQRLRLLRYRLENTPEDNLPPDIEFHNELAAVFNALRDLHTTYRLPSPFRGKFAWLPFIVEEYWEGDHRRFMVSNVVGKPGPASFTAGVEVLHWNGAPIEKVVTQNAERQAGSNLAARWARGLNSLTIRPLANGLPPDEEWVTLRYRYTDERGDPQTEEWTQPWLLFEPGRSTHSVIPGAAQTPATALGLDAHTDDIQEAKRVLYAGDVVMREREAARAAEGGDAIANMELAGALDTFLPTIFRAMEVEDAGVKYGYIRIFTFNVSDADGFVDEFVRLAGNLPENGLIVDVRGNGGGLIYAAEELLQVLTPRRIEPQVAQFINTPVNLQICRNHAESTQFAGLVLKPWIQSIQQAVETGSTYSLSYSISDPTRCNARGQAYYGPVVLITDALCYSATDMFAAGFQDHAIGPVLGVSDNTGAGGANVWSHALLRQLMATNDPAAVPTPYKPLPKGADLRVAIRRTLRVRENTGAVLEDLGVRPDAIHRMTRRDVLGHNEDLIAKAVSLLSGRRAYAFNVRKIQTGGELPRLRVESRNVNRLDVYYNDHPLTSLQITRRRTDIDLPALVGEAVAGTRNLELRGFDGEELVAAHREKI